MGRVQSSLVLHDGMTAALRRINKAMELMCKNFDAVERATGKDVSLKGLNEMHKLVDQTNAELDRMEDEYRRINDGQDKLNRRIREGSDAAGGLWGKLTRIVSAYTGVRSVGKLVSLSDESMQTRARLSMMNDGSQTDDELRRMIFASAERSRGNYTATADAVAKLGLMAGDAFGSNKETVAFMEQINKQFKIAGTTSAGIDAAMLQLTQAMGSGILRGEEFNSILEQAPNIIQSIADYLEVPKGQLKDMAAEGKITAGVVKAAIFAAADETNAKFESMPRTWGDIWTSVCNRALMGLDPLLKKINALANSSRGQKTVDGLVSALSVMANVLGTVFDGACAVYNFVSDNWSLIAPVIGGIVTVLLLYNSAMLANNMITGISTALTAAKAFAEQVHAASLARQAGATVSATVAQYGLNAAMAACPVTWILLAVIALCVVFAAFTEEVVGATWVAGAFFKNIGLWFANVGLGIWQSAKAIFGNIGAAFSNGWIDIQKGFWTGLNVIMSGIKLLAEKANRCLGWMGVNIDTSGLDFAAKKIDELNGKKQAYASVSDAWKSGYGTYDVFGDGWAREAYDRGATIGAGIKDWLNDNLSFTGITGLDGTADDIGYTLGDISDDVGGISDSIDRTEEDLSYLRDIAEMDAVNRFTTAEVRIDMSGMTNRIDSDMDLDGVISVLTDGFAEALEIAAEGVHS